MSVLITFAGYLVPVLPLSSFTTISRTPNHVFVLSAVAIALIAFTPFKSRPVIFISCGKLYSSPLTSIHSTPSVVY